MAKRTKEILTEDWRPQHDPLDYPDAFVAWIDSINAGFKDRIEYEPFNIYCAQSEQWLKDDDDITDYHDVDDQVQHIVTERDRCRENSLYALNKRLHLKDTEAPNGKQKFDAWECQKIVLFLADCGYNLSIGKARQIGLTTCLGGWASNKINVKPSFFVKFIAQDREKTEEIFEDKIKFAFYNYEDWFKQEVSNDSHNMLALAKRGEKGKATGANSRIQVATPTYDAINGGSPDVTLVDEQGMIKMLSRMISEGRPTLYYINPETKKIALRRQLLMWGTGGEMSKAGSIFEAEYKAAMKNWKERNFNYAIIPIFFDAYAREGVDDEFLKSEKKAYYSTSGPEAEIKKVQYHQAYPITIDDMFLRSSNTLIPMPEINKMILKIHQIPAKDAPQYGYFVPVFDKTQPVTESDVPFKILGSTWVPTEGMDDERTTTVIYRHPMHVFNGEIWVHRYYQGTDPINSETGHSMMSSAIWDDELAEVSCVVNFRVQRFVECYLQCLLAGLYYEPGKGAKELIENNIGDNYYLYKDAKGFSKNIVANKTLHPTMQTSTTKAKWWGISNKTNTASRITNKTIDLLELHRGNIFILWFWLQMKTFVEKTLSENSARETRFQAQNRQYDFDDVIFSITFAYLCGEIHDRYTAKVINAKSKSKNKTITVQNAETNYSPRRAMVDGDGKIIRYISDGGRKQRN